MIRMVHNTFLLCYKIYTRVQEETNNNIKKNKNYHFWQDKFANKHNNGICPCCKTNIETADHLFGYCTHQKINYLRNKIYHKLHTLIRSYTEDRNNNIPVWYCCDFRNNINNFDPYLGTCDFIPKEVEKFLHENM